MFLFPTAAGILETTVIKKLTAWIASILVPGGGLLRAAQAIYAVGNWTFSNARQFGKLAETFVSGVEELAGGGGALASKVVGALKGLIAPVLDFFAKLWVADKLGTWTPDTFSDHRMVESP